MSRLNPAVAISIGALLALTACGGSSDTPDATSPHAQATQQTAPADDSAGDAGSVDNFCAAAEKLDALDLDEDVTATELKQLESLVDDLTSSAPGGLRQDVALYYGEILKLAKAGTALRDLQEASPDLQKAMGNVFEYGVDHCYQAEKDSAYAAMDDWEAPSV